MPIVLALLIGAFGVGAAIVLHAKRKEAEARERERQRRIHGVVTVGPIRMIRPTEPGPAEERADVRPPQPAASSDDEVQRRRLLADLEALKRWAESLPIYTRAMWASDLLRMKARAEALNAQGWPIPATAQFLVEARALRQRIA